MHCLKIPGPKQGWGWFADAAVACRRDGGNVSLRDPSLGDGLCDMLCGRRFKPQSKDMNVTAVSASHDVGQDAKWFRDRLAPHEFLGR